MNISVTPIEVKNDYCVPDYSNSGSEATNSHLYQSIEEANHVYDEIISTKPERGDERRKCEGDDEGKPNNYENNESMNCELLKITPIIF
jgi:predicted transposase YdaD